MVNCPNCGTSNLDNSAVCVNCGRSLTAGAQQQTYTPPPPSFGAPPPPPPPGGNNTAVIVYLVISILMLLCCCNPVALVPLIFAIMSISSRNKGDAAGAAQNASRTTMWFWISIGCLILWYIVFFGFMGGAAFLEQMQQNMPR